MSIDIGQGEIFAVVSNAMRNIFFAATLVPGRGGTDYLLTCGRNSGGDEHQVAASRSEISCTKFEIRRYYYHTAIDR
jgi:hypothetical protein